MVTRGEGGRDKLGDWGRHADTTIYKIKSEQEDSEGLGREGGGGWGSGWGIHANP